MKVFLKLSIGLVFILILSGCIGESYDFSPPTITLSSNSNMSSEELVEANIDWRGEGNNPIDKETEDSIALAKQQQQMHFIAGEKVDLLSNHADFKTEALRVSVWQNDKKLDLEVTGISFYLPKETGDYVIEVNLQTDRGKAQYVGNVFIK
ncbi:hypothetical protein [Bacillus sinesaloumensis]|uniref:hypothetical protein n=1 Tax=Litchfieldia sinesaloumensis TaxID=1926280 RepID=UPI00098878C0|nr:hypothetical protein [Bacillus sinesaloumensis]